MSNQDNTPRYDVNTESDNPYFGLLGSDWDVHNVTIRDNNTGKEYSAANYDAEKARDAAWDKVHQDND